MINAKISTHNKKQNKKQNKRPKCDFKIIGLIKTKKNIPTNQK
jgi:hypothetical protein